MGDKKYERTITPAPEVLSATATVGFVLEQISSDLSRHERADADAHRDMWNGITKVDLKVNRTGLREDRASVRWSRSTGSFASSTDTDHLLCL